MRRYFPHLAVTLSLLALLAGCKQPQSTAPEGTAGATLPTEGAAQVPASPPGLFYLTPDKLAACEPGAVVVVHWDTKISRPDIANVEIWTGAPGSQTLFAAGGYAGEASTVQPWARPGTTFSLRNKVDGEQVATAIVGGPACGK